MGDATETRLSTSAQRSSSHRRTLAWTVTGVALAAMLATVVWWQGSSVTTPPNVVLLSIDTLRADRLGCYGGSVATPNIDRLASEGALFENAACPMPMTRPSLATIHTSLYPREHGVESNARTLSPDAVTLAEVLQAAGYETAAFTPARLLSPSSGLAQGFATYSAPQAHHVDARSAATLALDWLATRDPAKPFFLWLHLFDPHLPYAPPPEYVAGTSDREISWQSLIATAREHGGDVPSSVLERALELYAGEVAYVDHWVGAVRAKLEELGALENTVVVFTADHGECFDHGIFFEHADCLYDGAVRVPLLVRYPPLIRARSRVASQVENLDVAPTILALAGLPPAPTFHGRSLLEAPASSQDRFALIEHPVYEAQSAQERARKQSRVRSVAGIATRPILSDRPSYAVRSSTWKLVTDGASTELYDLRSDPAETIAVATAQAATAADLQRRLRTMLAERPAQLRSGDDPDPRLHETLKALGYVQ